MSTSLRGESVKSFLDDYVNPKISLKDFIDQIELALQRSYSAEEKTDLETYQRSGSLVTESPYESQMASVHTMEITVSCICHLFEFKGYPCRHAMVVLFSVGVFDIPSRYILKRWTWNAKDIDICNGAQESGPEFAAKCFSDLHVDCQKLADEGCLTKERYRTAKKFLKEALIKVLWIRYPGSASSAQSKESQQIPWNQNSF